ncbi:MAG: CPBP family intramembrane metalloprotease [Blautia sp.]|nr:CPBP family intramembrane metalloprotease [Blautia sp.]
MFRLWRYIYPAGIHFGISNVLQLFYLLALSAFIGGRAFYEGGLINRYVIELTGLTGLLTTVPCFLLYRKDQRNREYGRMIPKPAGSRIEVPGMILLLSLGAALSLYGNIIVNFFARYIDLNIEGYSDQMEVFENGKSLLLLIIFMGIVAPVAEEAVFRWLIYLRLRDAVGIFPALLISSLFFGIYHGNLVQAVYAGLLGAAFAFSMEMTGSILSPVLLHVGANGYSLVLDELAGTAASGTAESIIDSFYGISLMAGILIIGVSFIWMIRRGRVRGYRAV